MSAATTPTTARDERPAPQRSPLAASARRVGSLARAELLLLVRNRTALFNALLLSPLTVVFLAAVTGLPDDDAGAQALFGASLMTMLVAFSLLFVVYYNLTTALVARREEVVLKRLLTGESNAAEILTATAAPALAVMLGQAVLGTVAVVALMEPPAFTNPVLLLVALLGGTVVFVLLAAASTGFTRTVESAQLTTLPVLLVTLLFSGLSLPLSMLPDLVQRLAALTPLHPVVALMRLGLSGTDADGAVLTFAETFAAAVGPLAVLVAWVLVGVLAMRRWMRWQPRR
ncbi:ABC transporter permease [Xylanimonas oleitrophica]|uniref:ABC transporter permease n=1 Tax=Xylanimonas oleitrophica TaxID=2607479 RepID=A0A2W5Y321_9MICO|nr:ABC transporter permease [Xylanimonas oleitrophica]PZR52114.1 ABC transporter permease [Xylanimonas oleitrophica]